MMPANIIAVLEAAAATLTQGSGYAYNYGALDIHRPSQWILPQPFMTIGDETPRIRGLVGKMENDLVLTWRVMAPAVAFPESVLDICSAIELDLKTLMATNESSLRQVGVIRVDYLGATWLPRLVASSPAEVTVKFNLWYRQSRTNPSSL